MNCATSFCTKLLKEGRSIRIIMDQNDFVCCLFCEIIYHSINSTFVILCVIFAAITFESNLTKILVILFGTLYSVIGIFLPVFVGKCAIESR